MGVRTWVLRRAMGRLRITDDIVRYLSTFQRLVGNAPVVETVMRVPGGEVAHRVYAVAGLPAGVGDGEAGAGPGSAGELTVVEVENASPVPVVIALAVRPYNPEGLAVVERID